MSLPIQRRDFLKTTTAAFGALAVPNLIPATVFGANNKIAIGCIGVGSRGRADMNVFLGLEDCRVVAVCEPYKDRQEKARGMLDGK